MTTFQDIFGNRPEVYARAPGRVTLLGEHTEDNEGFVLPIAVAQSTRVALRRNARGNSRVHDVASGRTVSLAPGARATDAASDACAHVVGAALVEAARDGATLPVLDILVVSDLPSGAGLSADTALTVAVLRAVRDLLDLELDDVRLALMAQRAQAEHRRRRCGLTAPMACSLADTRSALLLDTRTLRHQLVPLPEGSSVLVLHSGVAATELDALRAQRRLECEAAAAALGVPALRDAEYLSAVEQLADDALRRRARHVVSENQRVLSAAAGSDAAGLGSLMNASHASLRDDYEATAPGVDRLVALLQQHPAVYGARMTGPGWGGPVLALCRYGEQEDVARDVLPAYAATGGRGHVLVPQLQAPLRR